MVVTDAEPDRLAPLAPPAPLGLRGVWVVRRAVAPTPWRGVLTCPRASVRGRSRRAPPPKSGPRPALARALLLIIGARANSKQARVLALLRRPNGATIASHHGIHRLAAALGAGVLCRRGAQEARAQACLGEDRRRPCLPDRWRCKPGAIDPDATAAQPSA